MKKSCKRLTRKNSGLKSKQKKDSEALSNGRAMIVGLIQKIYYKDFPELFEHSGGSVKTELDHATKVDIKRATGIDTSMLALKTDLDNLKT